MTDQTTEEDIVEAQVEQPAVDTPADPGAPEQITEEQQPVDGELVITIGDEEQPQGTEPEADWLKELRHQNRTRAQQIRDLTAENARLKAASAPAPVVVGPKPTMESCGFDESKLDTELAAWHERKAAADAEANRREAAAKADREAWQARLAAHNTAARSLKVPDYESAAETARDIFDVTQQGIILRGVQDANLAAKIIYALGTNPKKAKELAGLTDPVQFAVAIGEIKTMLKITPRKAPPPPERIVRGDASIANPGDQKLEALRAEADRTGDRTKVVRYLREQQQKRA